MTETIIAIIGGLIVILIERLGSKWWKRFQARQDVIRQAREFFSTDGKYRGVIELYPLRRSVDRLEELEKKA